MQSGHLEGLLGAPGREEDRLWLWRVRDLRRPLCVHFHSRWHVSIWEDVLLPRVWLGLAPVASYFHLSAKKKKCSEMPGNIKIDAETIKCFSWASETGCFY